MSEENPDDVEPVDDERVGFSEEVFGEEFNIGWICKGLRRKDILRLFLRIFGLMLGSFRRTLATTKQSRPFLNSFLTFFRTTLRL